MATEPFAYQKKEFEKTKNEIAYAYFWDMGTGKTKMMLDTCGWLYAQGEIDGLLVVAPNGVHQNWISDEIPKHLHKSVEYSAMSYSTTKYKTIKHKEQLEAVINASGLAVLTISYDAFVTSHGKAAAKQFLTTRKCLYVLDESTRIKNPNAERTKVILASAPYGKYRRILTGTPIANGPFDVYSQMKFLDKDYWLPHGFGSYTIFKFFFGVFHKMTNPANGRLFDHLTSYQNLDILNRILNQRSTRVTKDQVLDLPKKLYTKRYFDMTAKQLEMYHRLRLEFIAEIDGSEVNAALAVVRMTRLQQVLSGYVGTISDDGERDTKVIGDVNARLDCLRDVLEDIVGPVIIWAKFTKDIDLICQMLGKKAVRYDGQVGDEGRQQARWKFHNGEATYFVANQQCGGEGLTLNEAKTVVYYNNTFKLPERLQSEDRCHRIGQTENVTYIDIVCKGTIDEKIAKALVEKQDVASLITGDALKSWL